MKPLRIVLIVGALAFVGCRQCGRSRNEPKLFSSNERHLAVTACGNSPYARAYALMDGTIISYERMRFGIATLDEHGLDTSIEAGFLEAGGSISSREDIMQMSGRLDDLWVVVRNVPLGSETAYEPYQRLMHRRGGQWAAIPLAESEARYDPPVLYRGGAFTEVRLESLKGDRKRIGFDLPPGIDLDHLFPADAGTPTALETGEVVAPGLSDIYILHTDGRKDRVPLPEKQRGDEHGPVHMTGVSRATLRVFPNERTYRLAGNELVLDDAWDADIQLTRRFREDRSTVMAFDGELFASEGPHVFRGRAPVKPFECPPTRSDRDAR